MATLLSLQQPSTGLTLTVATEERAPHGVVATVSVRGPRGLWRGRIKQWTPAGMVRAIEGLREDYPAANGWIEMEER